jgi:YHS domain-containing protein
MDDMQITRRYLLLFGVALTSVFAAPQSDPINQDRSGVAIKGYDAVAYFTQGKPVKGAAEFTHQYNGATWWFASAADRDEFARTPEKYAPQYGGYCAYGVSKGHTAPIDPEAWTIVEGKLYLNYSKGVKKTWSEAIPQHIEQANKNWPGLHK